MDLGSSYGILNNFSVDLLSQQFIEEDIRQFPPSFIAPVLLVWELTNECKSNCRYCFGSFCERDEHELKAEEKITLADELVKMKVFNVTLSGGEPLLCETLPDIVEILHSGGINTIICTSGIGMTDEIAQKLVRGHAVGFSISLDSFDEFKNDSIRGKKGALNGAVNAVKLLRKFGGEQVPIALECVLTKENYNDIEEYVQKSIELGVMGVKFQGVVAIGRGTEINELTLTLEDIEEVKQRIHELYRRYYLEFMEQKSPNFIHIDFVDQAKHIDLGLKTGTNWGGIIEPNGNLRPSGYLDVVFGDYRKYGSYQGLWDAGFKNAWKHPFLQQFAGKIKNIKDIEKVADMYEITNIKLEVSEIVR